MSSIRLKKANFLYAWGAGSILLLFWAALAALPCMQFGIWVDSEPVTIACGVLIAIAGLFAITFLPTKLPNSPLLSLTTFRDKIGALHPAWFCIWGLPLLGLFLLPLHPYPLLSLLGPANLGQGIINGFMIAIGTMAMGFFLRQTPLLLSVGVIVAGLGLTLCSYLSTSITGLGDSLMLHNFRSWLAVVALGILALGFIYTSFHKRLALILCAGIILFLSQNKTVILCFLVCLFFSGVLRFFNKSTWLNHKGWGIFLAILPFLCVFGIIIGANFEELNSITSRSYLLQAVWLYLLDHPLTMFTGTGWGRFGDILLTELPKLPVQFYQEGIYNPSSDILTHLDYHPMHQGVETLLAVGIGGLIIDIILPLLLWIKLPYHQRSWGLLILVPLICYQSLWFYSPMTTPYLILIYALFITRSHTSPQLKLSSKVSSAIVIFAILLATAYRAYVALFSTYEDHFLKRFFNTSEVTCDSLVLAQGPGQMHLSQYLYFLPHTFKAKQHDKESIKHSLKEAICACNAIKSPTLTFLIAEVYFYRYILSDAQIPFSPEQKRQFELSWKQKIFESLKIAPLRTDISSTYLIYMLHQKDFVATEKMIAYLYSKDAHDAVALWFEGLLLIKSKSDIQKGENLLRQALTKNIQRLLPISKNFLNSLNITLE